MRIVIIGANGNVGREVSLRLAACPGVDLVPVCRTRGGSAFLRYKGVRCLHANASDPAAAARLLEGADVVANFALPAGDPARARAATRALSQSLLDNAPPQARQVYFSTLAVHGGYDRPGGRPVVSQYGRSKKAAEAHFLRRANRLRRSAFVVRLGHVTGELQPMSAMIREAVAGSAPVEVDGSRPANLVHIVMITELLHRLGRDAGPPPGRYDLLNSPNWNWREAYRYEAGKLGLDAEKLVFLPPPPSAGQTGGGRAIARSLVRAVIGSKSGSARAIRLLEKLPPRFEEKARALYLRQLVRSHIQRDAPGRPAQPAFFWPELGHDMVPGMDSTRVLLAKWPMPDTAESWPADL